MNERILRIITCVIGIGCIRACTAAPHQQINTYEYDSPSPYEQLGEVQQERARQEMSIIENNREP